MGTCSLEAVGAAPLAELGAGAICLLPWSLETRPREEAGAAGAAVSVPTGPGVRTPELSVARAWSSRKLLFSEPQRGGFSKDDVRFPLTFIRYRLLLLLQL